MKNYLLLSIVALIFCNSIVHADYAMYQCQGQLIQRYGTKIEAERVCGKDKVEEVKIRETAEEERERIDREKSAVKLYMKAPLLGHPQG